MEIQDRIILIRKHLGLSQAAFAEEIGLKRNSITLIETKRRNLSERTVKDICNKFNVNYLWLIEGIEPMINSDYDTSLSKIDYIMTGENEIAKSTFNVLAELDEKEWKLLETILLKLFDSLQKKD